MLQVDATERAARLGRIAAILIALARLADETGPDDNEPDEAGKKESE
jgi:hypothetical protein